MYQEIPKCITWVTKYILPCPFCLTVNLTFPNYKVSYSNQDSDFSLCLLFSMISSKLLGNSNVLKYNGNFVVHDGGIVHPLENRNSHPAQMKS